MAESADDLAAYRSIGAQLVTAVEQVVEDWVRRCVAIRCTDSGTPLTDEVRRATDAAAVACRDQVVRELREAVAADPDSPAPTPLSVLRRAVAFPTDVLRGAGVPPVVRDGFAERHDPDDVYGLAPAAFGDVDPALTDPGIAWGAAKAHVHLRRHAD